jgi:hypothetical protein
MFWKWNKTICFHFYLFCWVYVCICECWRVCVCLCVRRCWYLWCCTKSWPQKGNYHHNNTKQSDRDKNIQKRCNHQWKYAISQQTHTLKEWSKQSSNQIKHFNWDEMKWNEMWKEEYVNVRERVCVCVWYRVWLLCMTYAWPLSKITFNVTIKAPTQTITNAAAKRTVRWSPGALLYRNLNSNTKKIQNWSLSFSLFKINSIKWNSFHFLSLLFFQFEVFGKSFLSLTKWNESYKWFSHCKKKTNNQWSPKIP